MPGVREPMAAPAAAPRARQGTRADPAALDEAAAEVGGAGGARLAPADVGPVAVSRGQLAALGGLAGNQAVQRLLTGRGRGGTRGGTPGGGLAVQRAGPAPEPYAPPDGMQSLGVAPSGMPLGETTPGPAPPPQFRLRDPTATDGGYEAGLEPTALGEPTITAVYPAPGVYTVAPAASGRPRRALVDPDVSDLVMRGEQEHSDDFWWAYRLAYGPVVAAINALAAQPARRGTDVRDVSRRWRVAVNAALPPALRVPLEEPTPVGSWIQVYGRLLAVSFERDRRGWHSMGAGFATAADREAHGIGTEEDLLRVLPRPGDIGVHGSQERVREALAALDGS